MKPLLRVLIVSSVVSFALAVSPASAQVSEAKEPNGPTLTTSGEGIVRRAPDRAFVRVTVESRARNPRDAQAQNAQAMTGVQQKLRSANLAKDAIRTIGYVVDAEYDFANGRRTLRGYVARNTIEVRIDDLGRAGEIMDLATNAGATSVGDLRYELKDRAAAEREALAAAVVDAKARAEAIAAAAGQSIRTIWRISESGVSGGPEPRPVMAPRMLAAEAAVPTPIVSGEIEIRASVTLTALLK